jgi:membrane protease YdiL (CAAX protease family)
MAIFLNNISHPPRKDNDKEIFSQITKEKITAAPEKSLPLAGVGILYLVLLTAGMLNLADLVVRKMNKKPILDIDEAKKIFPLNEELSAKLIFIILLLIFLLYASGISFAGLAKVIPALKPFKNYLSSQKTNFPIIVNLIIEIAAIAATVAFLKPSFLFSPLKKSHLAATLKTYTAMIPILLAAAVANNFIAEALGLKYSLNPAVELVLASKNIFFSLLLCGQIIILGPVAEELFFRGFIYRLVRKKYSSVAAAVLTSIFFVLPHGTPQYFLPLLVISLCLCYLYEKTQNITLPIIFHSIFNSTSLITLLAVKNAL